MEIDASIATIIVAIISGLVTIIATSVNVHSGNKQLIQDVTNKLETHNAIQDEKIANLAQRTDEKIADLAKAVHENNNLKVRVPVLEEKVQTLEEKVKVLERH